MSKHYIYLDDTRTPVSKDWLVVRNIEEFSNLINSLKFEDIAHISFDHDLGFFSMKQYFVNVANLKEIDYNDIHEHNEYTGLDCAKLLVNKFYDIYGEAELVPRSNFVFPKCTTHSANTVGRYNIIGYLENFYHIEAQYDLKVDSVNIEHTISSN